MGLEALKAAVADANMALVAVRASSSSRSAT